MMIRSLRLLAGIIKSGHRQQGGQILILSMILLALASIMIIPLANFINTGLKSTQVYQRNAREIYAADRGIQHGIWKIKYDSQMASDRGDGMYDSYPAYSLPTIDNNNLSVQISGNWLFYYLFRMPMGETPHNINLTTTSTPNNGLYTLTFTNSQHPDGPPVQPTVIDSMGVWLPPGFDYVNGSAAGITDDDPIISSVYAGTNLKWDNVNQRLGKYESATQTFNYTPEDCTPIGAASWVFPQQQSIGASWNDAIWWYDVISTAVDTSVTPNKTTTAHGVVVFDTENSSNLNLVTYLLE
jgi:hypothetical protein